MSVFLQRPEADHVAANALAFAIRDGFPVSPGHTLVIPRRLVATWFEATREEQLAILELVDVVKAQLDAEFHPDGYNIGINAGVAAGQTVMHLHVHLIPRYSGDVADPRGGVRHLMPGKGNYLAKEFKPAGARAEALATGGAEDPFYQHLLPLFAKATDVAILAAFSQHRGVEELEPLVLAAADRGARVRLMTGDYLNITQRTALEALLAWTAREDPAAGALTPEVRIVETAKLTTSSRSFHPKAWCFEGSDFAVAFVGSSNVSRAALFDGVEWNLRIDRERDRDGHARVLEAFEHWWQWARPLDQAFLDGYRDRPAPYLAEPAELPAEPLESPPQPHPIQTQALAELAEARQRGRGRTLVVMATGLGKTWLAAFDALQLAAELGRAPRILFLAHRDELLRQAARTLRRAFPEASQGFYAGSQNNLGAQMVFASVQKLCRPSSLALLQAERFDYAVVDEVHHATADSYRRVLAELRAAFVLGLTATPDRTDQADVQALFDDHVAFRADIGVGIASGRLAPFRYFGLQDDTNYQNIPWHNGRFDAEELGQALATQARMQRAWVGWQQHPGTRTLVFCCTVAHAEFVAAWLRAQGVRVQAVHSGPTSADRVGALSQLEAGELEAVCAVDLFNEGIDVPLIDRVVMLRPSESPVVFLQQLGRGLRAAEGKEALTVIDFVGNHLVFLRRLRTLLDAVPGAGDQVNLANWLAGARAAAAARTGALELPQGCGIQLDLEAVDLLTALLPKTSKNAAVQTFASFVAEHGHRPTAGELLRLDMNPNIKGFDGWFDFVAQQGQLTEQELAVLAAMGPFLRDLNTTPMSKCFKMVALQALVEADALATGLGLDELCQRSHAILMRSPELARDLEGLRDLPDPKQPEPESWRQYWRKNPIAAWMGESGKSGKAGWFSLKGEHFAPRFGVPESLVATAAAMVSELVDWRLLQYRRRSSGPVGASAFDCKLLRNSKHAILKLPGTRSPWANTVLQASVAGGELWSFRFAAEYCNVAYPAVSTGARNQLGELLVQLFGEQAGQPGREDWLRFEQDGEEWRAVAVGREDARVLPLVPRVKVRALPSLRVAAGWLAGEQAGLASQTSQASQASQADDGLEEFDEVELPGPVPAGCVAVRVSGESMAGWRSEIRDGDWLVLRPAAGVGFGAVEGEVVVLARGDAEARTVHVKRVVRGDDGRWWLRSDNSEVAAVEVGVGDEVLGVVWGDNGR